MSHVDALMQRAEYVVCNKVYVVLKDIFNSK